MGFSRQEYWSGVPLKLCLYNYSAIWEFYLELRGLDYTVTPPILPFVSFFIALLVHAKSFQACLTLCDPMDCSPPGSSIHGIL